MQRRSNPDIYRSTIELKMWRCVELLFWIGCHSVFTFCWGSKLSYMSELSVGMDAALSSPNKETNWRRVQFCIGHANDRRLWDTVTNSSCCWFLPWPCPSQLPICFRVLMEMKAQVPKTDTKDPLKVMGVTLRENADCTACRPIPRRSSSWKIFASNTDDSIPNVQTQNKQRWWTQSCHSRSKKGILSSCQLYISSTKQGIRLSYSKSNTSS